MLARIIARTVSSVKSATRTMASSAITPLADRFIMFNFFEHPVPEEEAFFKYWYNVEKYVVTVDGHVSGHLHTSVLDKANKFPWFNFALFKHERVGPLGYPDPIFLKQVQGEKDGMIIRPGKYLEVASYNGEPLSYADKARPDSTRFIVTAVMAEDRLSCEELEKNWKKWMKTDYIHEKMKDHGVKDSLLYKEIEVLEPVRPPAIRYVVRTEVSNITDEEGAKFAKEVDDLPNEPGVTNHVGCFRVKVNATAENTPKFEG